VSAGGPPRDHFAWRDEIAAYLLGSLAPEEAAELERHLDDCPECREWLEWLRPAAEVLPEAVARVEPPAELRQRVLAVVQEDQRRSAPAAEPKRRRARFRDSLLRPATGLAGAAVIAAGIAGYAIGTGGGDEQQKTIPGPPQGGVIANVERTGEGGVLHVAGLAELGPGEQYQAWVRRGGRMEPSSLFEARPNGSARAPIPQDLDGADAILVTIEPRGGSGEPTSAPLVDLQLPE
jgi:anti-sigma-K factor RskA